MKKAPATIMGLFGRCIRDAHLVCRGRINGTIAMLGPVAIYV
jgi:hypothetical protein